MSLSELVKSYGFKDVPEVELLGHIKSRTLYNMLKRNDPQLRVHLLGCWIVKCGGV